MLIRKWSVESWVYLTSVGTRCTWVLGRWYCRHTVHSGIWALRISGNLGHGLLHSSRTDPPPQTPVTTYIRYVLRVLVRFRVLGVFGWYPCGFFSPVVLGGDW